MHATGTVEWVRLGEIEDDATFKLRETGDVSDLAASIGRLGQLAPVELRLRARADPQGPRWQVVAGFRRMEALRLLKRDQVLARLHEQLPDEDAWALALAHALLTEPLSMAELELLRARLETAGVAAWAGDLIDDAQVRAPVAAELRERFHAFLRGSRSTEEGEASGLEASEPEEAEGREEIEVTPEELTAELLRRFAQLNADLALAFAAWEDLPRESRRQLLAQARYVAELFPFLEAKTR